MFQALCQMLKIEFFPQSLHNWVFYPYPHTPKHFPRPHLTFYLMLYVILSQVRFIQRISSTQLLYFLTQLSFFNILCFRTSLLHLNSPCYSATSSYFLAGISLNIVQAKLHQSVVCCLWATSFGFISMSYKVLCGTDPTHLSCLISTFQHRPYAPGIPNDLQFLQILFLCILFSLPAMFFSPSTLVFKVQVNCNLSNFFQQVQLVLSPYMLSWHCGLLLSYSYHVLLQLCVYLLFFFFLVK